MGVTCSVQKLVQRPDPDHVSYIHTPLPTVLPNPLPFSPRPVHISHVSHTSSQKFSRDLQN